MTDPEPEEPQDTHTLQTRLRRVLPAIIVVLAVGTIALSIWGIASETEPRWLDTVADTLAWIAVIGVIVMVTLSRRGS
jgi:hypothetical protein